MNWKYRRLIGMAIGCGSIVLLLTGGSPATAGVRQGLTLCGEVVIPALFPVTAAALFLARSGGADALARLLAPVLAPLFRLPREACAVWLLSCLSGYPSGAALIGRLADERAVDGATAARMTTFCIHAGPGMIVAAVGAGMLGSVRAGWLLLGCHAAASLLIGAVGARFAPKPGKGPLRAAKREGAAGAFVGAVADACRQMLGLCGYVLLFSAAGAMLPAAGQRWLLPLMEITRGAAALAQGGCPLPLMAAALGFGGLSVQMQCLSLLGGKVPFGRLFAGRVLHAGVSASL
ncbi:MAG: hypothetical protein J6X61_03835, partial [Clostridia bacterium]|nr:hypothetical protein [Clostridia bacterium]